MSPPHPSASARRPSNLEELTLDECQERLAATAVGRLAFCTAEGPRILPINYAVADGNVYFRTTPEGSLASHAEGEPVAFEIDEADDFLKAGWSVLVLGVAQRIDDADLPQSLGAKPASWAAGQHSIAVRITTSQVTGRRIHSA
jgi:nitroimidazol reductase NimA-like FMN-containing flavoprotein (pyridoxamine 5'-phosphate oxidase superfamily)